MSEINLNVSVGEAVDKLTILSIKMDKINDDRRKDVEIEYNYLFSQLENITKKYPYYFNLLKEINLEIWNLQDEIRENHENFMQKCENVLFLNDARFTIKNKINNIANSKFKEQKGYKIRKCTIITENEKMIEKIKYISCFYDESNVISMNNQIFNDLKFDSINFENKIEGDLFNFENNEFSVTHPYLKLKFKK